MWNWLKKTFSGVSGRVARVLSSNTSHYTIARREYVELLQAFEDNPWLAAVVRRQCEAAANLTWSAYTPMNMSRVRRSWKKSNGPARKRGIEALLDSNELREVDHEILALLENPNPVMTKMEFLFVSLACLLLTGECFWNVRRAENGAIAELWVYPPHWIKKTPTVDEQFYKFNQRVNGEEQVPEEDVIYLRTPSLRSPYGRGVGAGRPLSHEIDIDEEASRHMLSYFHNGARPDLLIGVQEATQEEVERAKVKWNESTRGSDRAHATHFYSGDIQIHELSASFNDLQMVELRKAQRNNIIQSLGMPPEMLGILENANRSTIDASEYFFMKHNVVPLVQKLWYVLQFQLLPMLQASNGAKDVILDHENPVPEDKELVVKILKVAPETRTINEYRHLQGLPPLKEGGEELYKPSKSESGTNDPGNHERDDSEREDDAEAAAAE